MRRNASSNTVVFPDPVGAVCQVQIARQARTRYNEILVRAVSSLEHGTLHLVEVLKRKQPRFFGRICDQLQRTT